MRFEELHLERFGRFDGLRLDLSGPEIRLHLIHGPNEAGKSTVLSAVGDLLFGMGERTPYNFRHEYGRLRIGATLSNAAGQRLTFKRRKARVNSLLKPDESGELPDSSLVPYLVGVNRDFFERMFGLSHDRLRAGGREMLDPKNELARSLFEAGTGAAGLKALAEALAADADAIGSPARKSASKPYWRAHDRYDTAIDSMRADALKADVWNAAVRVVDDAVGHRRELDEKLTGLRRRRSALERVRRVVPLLRRMDGLDERIAAIGDGPRLPDDFEDTWRNSVQMEEAARSKVKALSDDVGRLTEELTALGDAGPWSAVRERIEKVATGLGDYRSKGNDLPHRIRDLETGRKQMGDLLRQLGVSMDPGDVAARSPSELALARVRSLIADWNQLDTAHGQAEEEFEKAKRRYALAAAAVGAAGQPTDPAIALAASEAAAAIGDAVGRVAEAGRQLDAADGELSVGVAALGRWNRTADELAKAVFPNVESVVRFERKLDGLAKDLVGARSDLLALEADRRKVDGDIETLRSGGEVPTVEALDSARARRDRGWRAIRRTYLEGGAPREVGASELASDEDVAGTFEASISAADRLADRREQEAARVERLATLTGQRAKLAEDIRANGELTERLENQEREAGLGWSALWEGTGVVPGTTTEMRAWLARRDGVVLLQQTARKAKQAVEAAEQAEEQVRSHLLRAADAIGLRDAATLDIASLRDRVKVAVNEAAELWTEKKQLDRARSDSEAERDDRKRDLDKVEALIGEWRSRWAIEMPTLGLAESAAAAEAEAALSIWQKIGVLEADLAQTRKRRDQVKEDTDAYEDEVRTLLADLGAEATELAADPDLSAVVLILQKRLAGSLQLAAKIEQAERNLENAQTALDDAETLVRESSGELQSLRDRHGLADDADVVPLARVSRERIAAETSKVEAHEALIAQGDGHDEGELRSEAAGVDADTAAADVAKLETEIGALQQDAQAAAQAVTLAETELRRLREREGIGEAAQAANDAAAEMQTHVEQWLRLRAASMILNRAVERYREANENPLIRRASEIFEAVAGTGENPIVRLSVDYTDEDRPVLMGFRRDGSICPVSGMSDGTADQLYLALRIAAVERYIDGGEPMPFIADDLFITSDEERTAPGIKALAELGKRTQVFLFTHHKYVVDAARDALDPKHLKLHSLLTPREIDSQAS